MPHRLADSTIANAGHYTAWGGGSVAMLGGLTANEFAALGGMAAAIGGLLVQLNFKRRDDRRKKIDEKRKAADEQRKQELHQLAVKRLKRLLQEGDA